MGTEATNPPRTLHSPTSPSFRPQETSLFETPLQPGGFHPYSRPTSSSSAPFSPDPSPYAGFAKKQRKLFQIETKNIENQVDLWSAISFDRVCDTLPEIRTFSSLTSRDYDILNPGEMGLISIDGSLLTSKIPPDVVPTDFWPSLQTLRRTCSRRKEMGVRQIIGHFLAYAVDIARRLFNMERLLVHTEVEIPLVAIPNVGKVHGPMDFLTCPAAGHIPMDFLMFRMDGAQIHPTDPYFICVEAKRQQKAEESSSKAQLLAQIRALQIQRDNKPRTGALTDGLKWSFWHNYNDGWYIYQFNSGSMDEALLVLRILVIFVSGKGPTTNANDPVYINPFGDK